MNKSCPLCFSENLREFGKSEPRPRADIERLGSQETRTIKCLDCKCEAPTRKWNDRALALSAVADAVRASKVDAAFVLAREIKFRKRAIRALEKFVFYDAWMDRHEDDAEVSSYKRHTFGDLREAIQVIRGAPSEDCTCEFATDDLGAPQMTEYSEILLNALGPIIEAVKTNDGDTLSRLDPDSKIIWTATSSWSSDAPITLGDLRAVAKAVATLSRS